MLESLPSGVTVLPQEPSSFKWLSIAESNKMGKPDSECKDADEDDEDDVTDEKAVGEGAVRMATMVRERFQRMSPRPMERVVEGEEEDEDEDDGGEDDNDDDDDEYDDGGDEDDEEEEEEKEEPPTKKRKGA